MGWLLYLIFSFSLFAEETVLRDSFLPQFLKQRAGWASADLARETVRIGTTQLVMVTSKIECGQGACERYVFVRKKNGSLRLAGIVYGRISSISQSGDGIVIQSTSSSGGLKDEQFPQSLTIQANEL